MAGEHSPDAGGSSRTAMIQPNVYWTLVVPFATIIGLYTNIPEGGVVEPAQQDWFAGELKDADAALPVIVALHHPPFSLDTQHSGSSAMSEVLSTASAGAGRKPDMVSPATFLTTSAPSRRPTAPSRPTSSPATAATTASGIAVETYTVPRPQGVLEQAAGPVRPAAL